MLRKNRGICGFWGTSWVLITMAPRNIIGCFAENLVGLGFLQSVSCIKPIPTHEKLFAVGKSGPNATFNLFFLGLGWPWIGEFVGFIMILTCFPSEQSLVYRKHRIYGVISGWFDLQCCPPRRRTRLSRALPALHAARPTPNGAPCSAQAMPVWSVKKKYVGKKWPKCHF